MKYKFFILTLFSTQIFSETPPIDLNKWMFTISPSIGNANTSVPVKYRYPYYQTNSLGIPNMDQFQLLRNDFLMDMKGSGYGIQFGAFKKNLAILSVIYEFPKAGEARLTGAVNYIQYTTEFFQNYNPVFGLGYFQGSTDGKLKKFSDFFPETGTIASFPELSVKQDYNSIFPILGIKIKIPIHNWSLTPYYSYAYETLKVDSQFSFGRMVPKMVLDQNPAYYYLPYLYQPNALTDILYPLGVKIKEDYYKNIVGSFFAIDYFYFLQLRGDINYNLQNHNKTIRLFPVILFHKNFGLTGYFEYSEKGSVISRYWFLGPSFNFQF